MWRSNGDGTHTRFCDYSLAHSETDYCSGGGATCTKEGLCDLCGRMYKAPHRDDAKDHLCDACDEKLSEHNFTAKNADKKYLASEATCTSPAVYYTSCALCGEKGAETFSSGEKDLNNHDLIHHAGKAAACTETSWVAYDTCSRCDYTTYKELPALEHDYKACTAKPTCTEDGCTRHACTRCGDTFTDRRVEKFWHWFGEWIPDADGTHNALCLREGCGYTGTVFCTPLEFVLTAEGEDAPFSLTFCPVCGEYADGARLALIEDAAAEAETAEDALPAGELTLRMGALGNGHVVMSVGFEYDGRLIQPEGRIRIALPAVLLEGHTLSLVSADGTETALPAETDGESASFILDFTSDESPVRLIRLLPAA